MTKTNNKRTTMAALCLLFALILMLVLSSVPGFGQPTSEYDGLQGYEGQYNQVQQMYDFTDTLLHQSPVNEDPGPAAEHGLAERFVAPRSSYVVGSTRQFVVMDASGDNTHSFQEGILVEQRDNINLWALTAETDVINAITPAIADRFDEITARMTSEIAPFAGTHVHLPYGSIPAVGDVNGDGRVNVIIYNNGVHFGGYFSSSHFWNRRGVGNIPAPTLQEPPNNSPIAMFAMHSNYLGVWESSRYPAFAHELQHLLFHIHFGVYQMYPWYSWSWLNEMLSNTAESFWQHPTEEFIAGELWRTSGLENYSMGRPGSATAPSDFIHRASAKNAGMDSFFGTYLHRRTDGAFLGGLYSYLMNTFPPSYDYASFRARQEDIASLGLPTILGNAFSTMGITQDYTGLEAFRYIYFSFMESFAADGGHVIKNGENFTTFPIFPHSNFSAYNFWGVRPNLGIAPSGTGAQAGTNGMFTDATGGWISLADNGRSAFPILTSPGTVNLTGYRGTPPYPPNGVTHEKFYRLAGETTTNPILTIQINDNNANTRYYVVIPNDPVGAVSSSENRTLGQDGATVHLLRGNNAQTHIDTGGQTAYLFAVTFMRNVSNVQVMYSWGNALPSPTPPPSIVPGDANSDGVVTAADVGIIRAYLAGFPVDICLYAADVNGDGQVTAADIGLIRAYLAGFPVVLGP